MHDPLYWWLDFSCRRNKGQTVDPKIEETYNSQRSSLMCVFNYPIVSSVRPTAALSPQRRCWFQRLFLPLILMLTICCLLRAGEFLSREKCCSNEIRALGEGVKNLLQVECGNSICEYWPLLRYLISLR